MSNSENFIQYAQIIEDYARITKLIPELKYRPLVSTAEYIEITNVLKQFPEVTFPITSGGGAS